MRARDSLRRLPPLHPLPPAPTRPHMCTRPPPTRFDFGEAGRLLYDFVWSDFADWCAAPADLRPVLHWARHMVHAQRAAHLQALPGAAAACCCADLIMHTLCWRTSRYPAGTLRQRRRGCMAPTRRRRRRCARRTPRVRAAPACAQQGAGLLVRPVVGRPPIGGCHLHPSTPADACRAGVRVRQGPEAGPPLHALHHRGDVAGAGLDGVMDGGRTGAGRWTSGDTAAAGPMRQLGSNLRLQPRGSQSTPAPRAAALGSRPPPPTNTRTHAGHAAHRPRAHHRAVARGGRAHRRRRRRAVWRAAGAPRSAPPDAAAALRCRRQRTGRAVHPPHVMMYRPPP